MLINKAIDNVRRAQEIQAKARADYYKSIIDVINASSILEELNEETNKPKGRK